VVQAQTLDLGTLRVYRIPFSTNVERVALAAGHKGIPVDWVDVDPGDRSVVERVSGQSLVPVLEHDGAVLTDSPRILDWLEERAPEPPLYPAEPARRAEVTVFVQWFNRVWKLAPNRLVEEDDEALRAELCGSLAVFEGLLAGRDYLFGTFGIADVTAFPFLKYAVFGLEATDTDPFHRILVDNLPVADDSPLRAWAQRVDAHPRA
jgi:glutathione S-transferase